MRDKRIEAIDYFWQNEIDAGNGSNAYSLYQAVQTYEFHKVTKGRAEAQANVIREPGRCQPLTEAVKAAALELV